MSENDIAAAPRAKLVHSTWNNIIYDFFLGIFFIITELFFREIHPRSTWKVPKQDPVIIVAAPHANQFVDPLILMRILRQDVGRRICFLVAQKSMKRKFVGRAVSVFGSVPVGRALDMKKPAQGKIYLPDPENDPTLVKGICVDFQDPCFQIGGLLVLPSVKNEAANAEILEIISSTEIRLKKPFKGSIALEQLTAPQGDGEKPGIRFSVAPHVDQSAVYDSVFEELRNNGCIGIFPEGGSHDRTELLPLKAGVAIMALGALAENPDCGVKIVPCGMNYFHAHKFRSRAVVEFGTPVEIPPALVEKYKSGDRREAVATVLDTVYQALVSVTVTAPDYETLMLIQAVRRLYNPAGKRLPLPVIVELNRRLVKGYQHFKNDPRIIALKKSILEYNRQLMMLNIRDHQVSYAKFPYVMVILLLLWRLGKLATLSVAVVPGTVLFAPIFIAGKTISIKKSREALAASSVKIRAHDVVATWKLLVAMALAPLLYTFYVILLAYWTYYNRIGGRVPDWVPLKAIVVFGYILFPAITFASLRFGEIGMDIAKSLRPLVLQLQPSSGNTMHKLRLRRANLVEQVTHVINELGPELYPDFDHYRIISDPSHPLHSPNATRPPTPRTSEFGLNMTSSSDAQSPVSPAFPHKDTSGGDNDHISRNESYGNLASVGIFASRPDTPNRSRSRDSSHSGKGQGNRKFSGLQPMTSLSVNNKDNAEKVSQGLRSAMRERRGRHGRQESGGEPSGASPVSIDGTSASELVDVAPSDDFEPERAKKDI